MAELDPKVVGRQVAAKLAGYLACEQCGHDVWEACANFQRFECVECEAEISAEGWEYADLEWILKGDISEIADHVQFYWTRIRL